jgi:hypothetical protein
MSSGWVRDAVIAVPVPFGWKLCLIVVPYAICLTVRVLGGALALGLVVVVVELEHPAVASRPAATTVAPSQVAVRTLKIFTRRLYALRVTRGAAELNAQMNGPWREESQTLYIWSTPCH